MQQFERASTILVLGGVRSGKSRYAQRLAEHWRRVAFIATAQCRDDEEMQRKIARHRSERPAHWITIEEPVSLGRVLQSAGSESDAILVDCLTLFSANLLEAHQDDDASLQAQIDSLCEALQSLPCAVILVSNEVGSGVVPAYASGRRFRDLAGEINQRVASLADTVHLMVAGIPLTVKGSGNGGKP
jgi:adenosylcobinamide kinase/adenosylcobinamide-phosphate guanylyltransferase